MKKTETIALYADEFFAGKSDEDRRIFYDKPVEKQYASIMAWKRRRELAKNEQSLASATAIAENLKKVKKAISALESMSPKDAEKLRSCLNEIYSDIDNFDKIKKAQLLRQLESEKEKMARESENLDRKIEALRQEIG